MNGGKSLFGSKTFWVNLLVFVAAVANLITTSVVFENSQIVGYATMVYSVVNILLRLTSSEAITSVVRTER